MEYEHRKKVSHFWEKEYDKNKLKAILQEIFGNENKKYILFGAGFYGIELSKWMEDIPLEIECFCDNNKKLWQRTVNGYPVTGIQSILSYKGQVNMIITPLKADDSITKQISSLGFVYNKDFVILRDIMSKFDNWIEF